jgi:hypothetical protein
MSELVYPHSIDAGTAITANEVQSNFEAVADVLNGQVQGGSGSDGNLAAGGVTARELADLMLVAGLPPYGAREGLITQPSGTTQALLVTPGAGLVLNYSAGTVWIRDDSGIVSAGALLPAVITGSTVTVGANASGNPRLDQVIATLTGYGTATVSVLPGTANAATTLNNRTGAAALPSDAIRIADVLVTNGFAGPFVNHTSLRNRVPWAVPMTFVLTAAAGALDIVVDSHTEEMLDIQHQLVSSANGQLSLTVEGGAASYAVVGTEVSVTSASALATATRGAWNASAAVLNLVPALVAAGGLKLSGRTHGSLKQTNSSWYSFVTDATAMSLTGSNAHVQSRFTLATTYAPGSGGVVSYASIVVSTGTLTGQIVIDRVPYLVA